MECLQPIDKSKSYNKAAVIFLIYQRLKKIHFHYLTSWLRKNVLFFLVVLAPWVSTATYLEFIKSPEYESSAGILFKQNNKLVPINRLSSFFNKNIQFNSKPKETSIFLLEEYIHSLNLLLQLQKMVEIKNRYSAHHIDFLSRLKTNASQNELLNYYNKKVITNINPITNELTVTVRAFSAQEAKMLLDAIMQQTSNLFHRIEQEGAEAQKQLIRKRLDLAKKKLIAAAWELQQIKKQPEMPVHDNIWEEKKLLLKFAQAEFDMTQQVYVLWNMHTSENSLIRTTQPITPDSPAYPKVFYELASLFAVLLVLFMLIKMFAIVIKEHTE